MLKRLNLSNKQRQRLVNNTKTKIKKGDKVRIINPEFFVRCGYDNNPSYCAEKIVADHKEDIVNLIKTVFPYRGRTGVTVTGEFRDFLIDGLCTNEEIMIIYDMKMGYL